MSRRFIRRVAVYLYEAGYRRPHTSWAYAIANGIESAWTIELWRHRGDQRADRYAGQSAARIIAIETGKVLAHHPLAGSDS